MRTLLALFILSASLLSSCGSDFKPAPASPGRRAHASVVINDKMYVFGGYTNGEFTNELWEYDITNDTWALKNPTGTPPGPRAYAAAVTNGSAMYIIGGSNSADRSNLLLYGDIWRFDPAGTGTWTPVTPGSMPALEGHSAVMSGSNIYIFGGYDGNDYSDNIWECPSTGVGTCSQMTPGPSKRAYQSVVLDGSIMYLFGGYGLNSFSQLSSLNDLWQYNISTDTWTDITPATSPAARSKHSMILGGAGTVLYVFGGSGSTSNRIWIYDIGANTWTENDEISSAPVSRAAHSAVLHSNKMYIYGGYISAGATVSQNDLWEFDAAPDPDVWTQKASLPEQ